MNWHNITTIIATPPATMLRPAGFCPHRLAPLASNSPAALSEPDGAGVMGNALTVDGLAVGGASAVAGAGVAVRANVEGAGVLGDTVGCTVAVDRMVGCGETAALGAVVFAGITAEVGGSVVVGDNEVPGGDVLGDTVDSTIAMGGTVLRGELVAEGVDVVAEVVADTVGSTVVGCDTVGRGETAAEGVGVLAEVIADVGGAVRALVVGESVFGATETEGEGLGVSAGLCVCVVVVPAPKHVERRPISFLEPPSYLNTSPVPDAAYADTYTSPALSTATNRGDKPTAELALLELSDLAVTAPSSTSSSSSSEPSSPGSHQFNSWPD